MPQLEINLCAGWEMQANQISAGQLMMSFMSKAKDDIREGIAFNGFSRELLAQCHTSGDTGTGQVPLQGSTALLGGDSRAFTSDHHVPVLSAEESADRELKPAGSSPAGNAPSMTDRRISEVKLREALYVSNPMVVEKILAQFQLPAEAGVVCAGSLNSRGGIPFNTIVAVLEQYNTGGASLQGEARAGSQEVAEFVASLQLMEGPALGDLRGIPVKPKGSYTLKEFKRLMKRVVACVHEAELKKADLRDGAGRNADKKEGSPAEGGVPSPASAPALAHGLSTQLVQSGPPLFMQPRERKAPHDLWEPVQNAPSFPSPEEPSRMHDGTRIQATVDLAPRVRQPAMGATVQSHESMETSPVPPPQVVGGDPADGGLHEAKSHEVLQILFARTSSQETTPHRLGGSNDAAMPGKADCVQEDHLQEKHAKEETELRSVRATGPSQAVFALSTAEPLGTRVEISPKDNRPLPQVDFLPPASADGSAQKPAQPVEPAYLEKGTRMDPSQEGERGLQASSAPTKSTFAVETQPDEPILQESLGQQNRAPFAMVGAGETVSATDPLVKNGEPGRVEDLKVAQHPDRMEIASFSHSRPSEPSASDEPRGKPIAPQGAPVVEGAERMADEQMPFQVSEKSSHERRHLETKRHDESAIWHRRSEKFSESAPVDESLVFSEGRGNMSASFKDNSLDSLEVIPKREPGTLEAPRPDGEFPHSRESGNSEGPETLTDTAGGDTKEQNTSSRMEKSPLGIDLANTSARSNTTFRDSDGNRKWSEDSPVVGITELDDTISDDASASPKAPDASAPRFALEASSSPMESQKGPRDSLSLEDAGWPQELGRRLTQLRGKDGNRLTLELAPRHLGKLVIQVEAHRDQVIAWLSTDNEQARSLLVQNAPLLRQQLQEQGLVLGQLQVSVGQDGREKNSQRQFESSYGKGEGGRGMEKLQSGRRSGPSHAHRAEDGDRRISLFA